ncbi:MAG: hypothetical protein KG075_07520 [Alphaproteobacteria bacterium]|nr:hypothetical protein [Alphaproteobacteria bacterium]
MNAFEKTLSEHRRIIILRVMEKSPSCTANCAILKDLVNSFGVTSTRDQIRNELRWLSEQQLATVSVIGDMLIGTATETGLDVARGVITREGVRRPSPDSI